VCSVFLGSNVAIFHFVSNSIQPIEISPGLSFSRFQQISFLQIQCPGFYPISLYSKTH
jgi:hypothetical protein